MQDRRKHFRNAHYSQDARLQDCTTGGESRVQREREREGAVWPGTVAGAGLCRKLSAHFSADTTNLTQ